ncbi:hypothetical protein M0805_007556 [Coniferiporia weirii]|nr:hypothetical protein M0805_007556 [Coniferiporia weirii]
MSKSHFYLSECAKAAEKSPMCFKLGAILVKGGKVISSGHNHHRPHYDGAEVRKHGHRKPVSMHAEMHAIFSLTGMSPSFKNQVQGVERRVPQRTTKPCRTPASSAGRREGAEQRSPIPKGCTASERRLSGAWNHQASAEVEGREETYEADTVEQSWTECEACPAAVDEREQQQWRSQRKREWGGEPSPGVFA